MSSKQRKRTVPRHHFNKLIVQYNVIAVLKTTLKYTESTVVQIIPVCICLAAFIEKEKIGRKSAAVRNRVASDAGSGLNL